MRAQQCSSVLFTAAVIVHFLFVVGFFCLLWASSVLLCHFSNLLQPRKKGEELKKENGVVVAEMFSRYIYDMFVTQACMYIMLPFFVVRVFMKIYLEFRTCVIDCSDAIKLGA